MPEGLQHADRFVSDFDEEVGLLPVDLGAIARRTRDWPQYVEYLEGDREILYEASLPVQGKAYTDIGWYLMLQPSSTELPTSNYRVDAITSLQFRRNGIWHNTEDWSYSVWEVEMSKDIKKYALWKPDPGHIRQVMASLNDFVDNKLTPILKRGKLQVVMSPKPTFAAESLVEMMLEGEVTRDRLNSIYNRLYKSAERTVKQHKPCSIQKDAKGSVICKGCKEHPEYDPHSRMHDYYKTAPNDLCCTGCEHHGEKGCQALKPLACKTWLCPTAAIQSPEAAKRLDTIAHRAAKVGMYDVRGSKQQSMDWAAKKWLQGDEETPVDQFKRWAKRVPAEAQVPNVESLVNEMLTST